jgi:phosphate transport system substrate-binding protein
VNRECIPGRRRLAAAALVPAALAALAAVSALAGLTACGASTAGKTAAAPANLDATPAAISGSPAADPLTLVETGSSTMAPVFALWASAYHGQYPSVTLTTAASNSVAGVSAAADGTADIGGSDMYLPAAETARYPDLRDIPLAVSAIAVAYNLPQVKAPLHLNGTVLAKMYDGAITKWNAPAIAKLNPGVRLPSTAITPVRRSGESGSTFVFTSYLHAQDVAGWPAASTAWPAPASKHAFDRTQGESTAAQLLAEVNGTEGAIGYAAITSTAQIEADRLAEAALENAAKNYALPTPAAIGAAATGFATDIPATENESLVNGTGQAYPAANYEYAIVHATQPDATRTRDLRSFLYWAITGGTAQLPQLSLQPLPAAVATLSQNQIAAIKVRQVNHTRR